MPTTRKSTIEPPTTSTSNPLLTHLLTTEPTFTPTRLPSLYSDLSLQRTTNPEGFAANASAWTAALTRLALARKLPSSSSSSSYSSSLSYSSSSEEVEVEVEEGEGEGDSLFILRVSEELVSKLSDGRYGRPVGLGCVFDWAVGEGKMMELQTFRNAEGCVYERKSWLRIPSVGEVVRWGLRWVGVLGSGSYDVDGRLRVRGGVGELVIVPALEEVARRVVVGVLKARQGLGVTGRVLSREEFGREVGRVLGMEGGVGVGRGDVELLLRHLQRDLGVLSYNESAVKVKAANAQTPGAVTEEDVAIANLKSVIQSLTAQTQKLEEQIANLQVKAAMAVKNKSRQSAMAALRSKSLATKQLEQRQATLQQLEDVYVQIENAASQMELVSTLKESAGVLKGLNQKVGHVGKVEDVLDELREEMGQTNEVQQVLNEPLMTDDVAIVDGEVDDEFEAMQKGEAEKKEKEEAEKTRARLADLERTRRLPVPVKETEKEKAGEEVDLDEELAKSVERLEGMSLDERMKHLSGKAEEVAAQ